MAVKYPFEWLGLNGYVGIRDFTINGTSISTMTKDISFTGNPAIDISWTVQNYVNTELGAHSVKLEWKYVEGAASRVVGTQWVYGSSAVVSGSVACTKLGKRGSSTQVRTYSATVHPLNATGMTINSQTNALSISLYYWVTTADSAGPRQVTHDISYNSRNVKYVGQANYPKIDIFTVERNGNETADLRLSCKGHYDSVEQFVLGDAVALEVNRGTGFVAVTGFSLTVNDILTGVTRSSMGGYQLPINASAKFRLRFYNEFEEASATVTVPMAFANINLAGYSTGGVSIGKFNASLQNEPLFECVYPMIQSGGIIGLTSFQNPFSGRTPALPNPLTASIGKWVDGKDIYMAAVTGTFSCTTSVADRNVVDGSGTNVSIGNHSKVISITGGLIRSSGEARMLSYYYSTSDYQMLHIDSNGNLIFRGRIASGTETITVNAIVWYTKN